MDTRTSFLWISVCVCLISGETVFAEVGSTAVLPCKLESVGTETPHIRWKRESEIVFDKDGEKSGVSERYEGRVDVPVEELRKGNCSLLLRILTLNDSDVYMSFHIMRLTKTSRELKKISSVYLSVREKTPEEKSDKAAGPTGDAGMTHSYPLIMIFITALISCFLVQIF